MGLDTLEDSRRPKPGVDDNSIHSSVKGGFDGVGSVISFCFSILTTLDILGRRVGDSCVHNRPTRTTLLTSSMSSISKLLSIISDTVFASKCFHVC